MAASHWFKTLTSVLVVILTIVFSQSAFAYPTYEDCADCHGGFRDSPYTSNHDGTNWGDDLMDAHANFVGGECDACHKSGSRGEVFLNFSIDGTLSKGCVGCHGRDEDVTGNCTGLAGALGGVEVQCGSGAGLRQNHESAVGTGTCAGCHFNDPAPVGENIQPFNYGQTGVVIQDACDGDGTESQFGSTGLNNDGDAQRDGADSDCQTNTPPGQPGTLSASAITTTSATVSWGASTDNEGDTITYQVDYRQNGVAPWTDGGSTTSTSQPLSSLLPGQSYDVRVTPNDGTVDGPDRTALALFETPAPDLVVISPGVSNPTPIELEAFMISATVQNIGNGASTATILRYYRSPDAVITTGDTLLDTDAIGVLAPAATSPQNTVQSIANAGTYWVGACVDNNGDESNGNNQCSSGVQVTVSVPTAPDLVVISPGVSNPTPFEDEVFTINATVQNIGNGASTATTLRYYRSTNATISTSDTLLDTDAVGILTPAATSPESTLQSIPDAGTYWVGACVDDNGNESNGDNQCSSGVQVTVAPAPAPDLVVISPGVSNPTPFAGEVFTINATVQNIGNADSTATTLRYYRSTNATISTSDTLLDTDAVGILTPAATSPESTLQSIPDAGTYWVGACVDDNGNESNSNNQCSTGVQLTVAPAPAPDLVVISPGVSNPTPFAGEMFTINATVQNTGNAASTATTLRYYLSTDALITTGDTPLDTDAVAALEPAATSPQSTLQSIPTAGTHWVGACVDDNGDESNSDNQCSTGVELTVAPAPAPDLVVVAPGVSDLTPFINEAFTISATVQNAGNAASTPTTLRYYLSADAVITTGDTLLDTDAVGALEPAATSPESTLQSIPTAGIQWVGACVDDNGDESNSSNQCSAAVSVDVKPLTFIFGDGFEQIGTPE
jgi:subtilase family serine protease